MSDKKNSFQERLKAFAEKERRKALSLPPGLEKERALQKINQAETAAHLDGWAGAGEVSLQFATKPVRPSTD